MIRASILGGTGYGGMELLRVLLGHPEVEVVALTSRSEDGPVGDRHPHLRGFTDLRFSIESESVRQQLAADSDVVFFAKPHGVSAAEVPGLLDAVPSARVIDLSGDFRLPDPSMYDAWYGFTHPHAERLKDAEYGLPECGQRDAVRDARLVANPGCHASASILALWPLARRGLIAGRVSVVSVTGSSGSGAMPKAGTHHPERFANYKAYRPLVHQHLPEIQNALGGQTRVDFVPHSAPFSRGIHVTAFVPVGKVSEQEVRAAYADVYDDEPFLRMGHGVELRASTGTNFVDLDLTCTDGLACVTLGMDNLGKGMAGTAIQNMNLMFGLLETTGLDRPGAGL